VRQAALLNERTVTGIWHRLMLPGLLSSGPETG
jgi:hypothetical protein